jgi:hypothetical protein
LNLELTICIGLVHQNLTGNRITLSMITEKRDLEDDRMDSAATAVTLTGPFFTIILATWIRTGCWPRST